MKNLIAIITLALTFSINAYAQDKMAKEKMMKNDMKKETMMAKESMTKTIVFEQTKGQFTQQNVTLKEGSYIFEIANNNVGHDVGFVLVPKGKDASNPENHIKTAYVTSTVKNNSEGHSNITKLSKGEYVYFCPLNPTPQYTLTVK